MNFVVLVLLEHCLIRHLKNFHISLSRRSKSHLSCKLMRKVLKTLGEGSKWNVEVRLVWSLNLIKDKAGSGSGVEVMKSRLRFLAPEEGSIREGGLEEM